MRGIPPRNRDSDFGISAAESLTPHDCERLIALSKDPRNFNVRGRVQERGSNVVDISIRDVDVWVVDERFQWVDDLILSEIRRQNEDVFNFEVSGLMERPQLLRYPEGGNYDWHVDIGRGDASARKLSVSWILNSDFDGGDLCFFQYGETSIPFRQGQGCVFPSFVPHKVQPVTFGERWALVAWISGTPFR